jgi:hypothetical protein
MTGDAPAARPHGSGAAVERPRKYVEAVRADANRAAERAARQLGRPPEYRMSEVIDWALGQRAEAPFTRTTTPAGARPDNVAAEIDACRRYLRSTPYTPEAADTISRTRRILKLLEWLTGADDLPPTYSRNTQPGDLVGGRGVIVRPYAELTRVMARARAQAETGDTDGYASGPGWYDGVLATITWINGGREDPPMAHPGGTSCSHPPAGGLPGAGDIRRELAAAAEHLEPGGYRHGSHSPGYADGVAATLRWLTGRTTIPPVRLR